MILPRERLLQLARLIGIDAFTERFGAPQTAEPEDDALRSLVGERLESIAARLVEEAAASDDVIDRTSADSYLEDRLATLGELLSSEQVARVRVAFTAATAGWD
ncbi:MAG: hypothetical protein WBD55_11275 [Dehalococcoidia bacterium]